MFESDSLGALGARLRDARSALVSTANTAAVVITSVYFAFCAAAFIAAACHCGGASVVAPVDAAADVVDAAADADSAANCGIANAVPSRDGECPSTSPHAFTCDLGGCVDESARGLWCCQ